MPGTAPHYLLKWARFTLQDTSAPQPAAPLGSLTNPGVHSGTETVGAKVTDQGAGVYRTVISVDGRKVSTTAAEDNQGRCVDADKSNSNAYEFLYPQPCALDTQVEAKLDTTKLDEGKHSLEVRVEDAAGNSTVVHDSTSFVVDNVEDAGPVPPVTPTTPPVPVTPQPPAPSPAPAVPGIPGAPGAPGQNGTPGQNGATPGAATRGAPNGSAPSDTARVSAQIGNTKQTARKIRFGRATKLQGRLVGPSGQPIAGATLTVLTRVEDGSSRLIEAGTVKTDADGRYSYTLAAGPTRTVRFAYRAYAGDSQFADTSDVQVKVIAKAVFKAGPRKLRNGRKVTFRGSVLGGHMPTAGLSVDLQVKQGGQWRTFGVAKANRKGKFSFGYRFTRTFKPTTYTFRALVRGDSSFPYVPGASNQAKVSVR